MSGFSKWKGMLVVAAVAAVVLAVPCAAHASTITYNFNEDYCTNPCLGSTIGGTITLNDASGLGTGTLVSVALSPDDFNSNPGKGGFETFAFNLSSAPSGTATNITGGAGSSWTYDGTTGAPYHEAGAGDFGYGLSCTNCGNSAGDVLAQTLSFFLPGVTIGNFAVLSTGGSPDAFFAADVTTVTTIPGTNTVCTGIIGSTGSSTTVGHTNTGPGCGGGGSNNGQTPVPEPASLALLGTGLALAANRLRKKRA